MAQSEYLCLERRLRAKPPEEHPPDQVEQVPHRAFVARFGPSGQADGICGSHTWSDGMAGRPARAGGRSSGTMRPRSGQTDRAPLTMAERFRRAADWVHPSRMPGPDHCLRRGASAPDSARLRELLQQSSDAPVTQQRRAGASSDLAPWRPKVTSCSRWTTSPIRPNLVFGTDRTGTAAPLRRSAKFGRATFSHSGPDNPSSGRRYCPVFNKNPRALSQIGSRNPA